MLKSLLAVGAVLVTAEILGRLAVVLRQPRVIGEITAGFVLAWLVSSVPTSAVSSLFAGGSLDVLEAVGTVALVGFMLGVGVDIGRSRHGRRGSASITLLSLLIPFALGVLVGAVLHSSVAAPIPLSRFAAVMGGALAVTALPVLSRIIRERGLAASRVASPALVAAAVSDAFAWLLLVVLAGNVTLGGDTAVLALGALLIVVLTAALCCRLQPGCVATAVAIAGAAAAAITSDLLSLHPGIGALAFGLVISKCPRVGDVIEAPERFALVLLPVWFCVPALSIDPGLLTTSANWTMFGVVALAAVVGKVVGGALGASIAGFDFRHAIAIGVLLNTRGLTELVFVTVALERGLLPMDVYVVLITVALVLTAATAPLLGLLRIGAPERAHRRSSAGPAR